MLEPDDEVSSIPNQTRIIQESVGDSEQMQVFSEKRDVTVSCVDTGSNHAETCTYEKEYDENSRKLGRSTRKSSVAELEFIARVEGVMILLDAKSMMIDFW